MEQGIRWNRIIGFLAVSFVLFELFCQVFVYLWAGGRYRSLSRNRWSPYGLVRNNPDCTSPGFHHDKSGFRNLQDFTQHKPPGTLRVMILGGSTMYSGLGGQVIEGVERVDSSSTVAQYLEQALRRDPELSGLNIEVINAAVNFNRIVEVSGAYIAEWAFWDPDVVIVGGSANNFSYFAPSGAVRARRWGIQTDHPWRLEFERIVNDQGFLSLAEKGVLTLEHHLASVALMRKLFTSAVDHAFVYSQALSTSLGIQLAATDAPAGPADWQEYDQYINEYLGYAEAMAAVARRHDQDMAFFWEYLLGRLGGIKPLSPIEQVLYQKNRLPTWETDAAFDSRARDQLAALCRQRGLRFLDPLDKLRTYGGTVYIDYLHYTREGNRFMAEFMYEQLRDVFHRRAARIRGTRGP